MARASARHILVDTQEACEELKTKIEAGGDFAALAREHSNCPSGSRGGELGEFSPGQMVREFDEVVFQKEVGKVHGPVKDPVRVSSDRDHEPHRLDPGRRRRVMPTNVPPQYKEAEARFRAAVTAEDKIAALEEMLRIMPKHKGTDKLQADLKTRLAKLRRQPTKKAGAKAASHMVPKEGSGQIALVGPPNGGKSSIVACTTHADPKVGEYPYTTREAMPGMMPFEDVTLQLIDLPPISTEHVEPWVFDCVRRADLVWVVVNHAGSLDGFEDTCTLLKDKHIGLYPVGRVPPEDESLSWVFKKAVVVLTGGDQPDSRDNLEAFRELMESPEGARMLWPTFLVSSEDGSGFEDLARITYEALGVIRIYSKQPGKDPDMEKPFTVPRDATVAELAQVIHKDLLEQFKFARIWGTTVFDGQRVQADHVLADKDVVEIHV